MDLLIPGSVLLFGGLMALGGLFDGGVDGEPEPNPDPDAGTPGNDTLRADEGIILGLGGEDTIIVGGDAKGYGGRGDDDVTATQGATGYGGFGDDRLNLIENANGYGDAGNGTLAANGSANAYGGDGNDNLTGNASLYGEDGDDVLVVDYAAAPAGNGDFYANSGHAYGGLGNDSLSGLGVVYGEAGNDFLISDGLNYGGSGDDSIGIGESGTGYGEAGNDTVTGHSGAYGGEGDDRMQAYDRVFGGAGNDVLSIVSYGGEFDGVGNADGGEGADTITAEDLRDFQAGALAGGTGDDVIGFYSGKDASGGIGDDVLIAQRSTSNGLASTISLGGGNDLLALDGYVPSGYSFIYDNGYATNLVTDFNPAQDQIGIIVPQAAQSSVSVTITPNIAGGYTDVIINLPGPIGNGDPNAHPPQTYRLQGVRGIDTSDILLFANQAAAQAGTSYGSLSPAA